jgi:hypothetical protein
MSQSRSEYTVKKNPPRRTQSYGAKLDKANAAIQSSGYKYKYIKPDSRAREGYIQEPGHAGYKYKNAIFCPNDSKAGKASFLGKEWQQYERPLTSRVESFNTQSDEGACFLIATAIKKHIGTMHKKGVPTDEIHKSIVDISLQELLKLKEK